MTTLSPRGYISRVGLCALGLGVLIVISPGIGTQSASVGWWDAWRARLGLTIHPSELLNRPLADHDGNGEISHKEMDDYREVARHIFKQRFARALLALLVGMTLALCGGTFQVLFRNPLATPYTLGIASGGALGATVAIRFGVHQALVGFPTTVLFALLGGVAVVCIVFILARGSRRLTSNELLLAGVTMGLFCSAMMITVQMISNERQTFRMVRWMMGSLDTITSGKPLTILPFVLPAWVILIGSARSLNQYRMGDDLALSRGVNVTRLVAVCVFVATLATAAVVAHCGPIGFVGLVVPHIVTLVLGRDCRVMLPAAAIAGGAFLILCDWASQIGMRAAGWATGRELGSAILPIGAVTAVVGVPVFLALLRTRRRFL